MSAKVLLVCSLLLAAGCASNKGVKTAPPAPRVMSALAPLVLEGPALHPSLVTVKVEDAAMLHLAKVLRENPQLSTDSAFVDILSRIASQGRLESGAGIRAALYALYLGEGEQLGLYGLEANSPANADRVEGVLRAIWAHNAGLARARVHRQDQVLVVAWNNGVSASLWEAMNAKVVERLAAR